MIKKTEFINWLENTKIVEEMPEDIREYYENFKNSNKKDALTPLGESILNTLATDREEPWSCKRIADELNLTGRTVSGGVRSLINKNFVIKITDSPVQYQITDSGIETINNMTKEQ